MKTISLKEAYNILENASAVIVDGSALVYPALAELDDTNTENNFMYLQWIDEDDGDEYCLKFNQGNNAYVKVQGCALYMYSDSAEDEEDLTKIVILNPTNLE